MVPAPIMNLRTERPYETKDIEQANPVFTFSEWTIYNDSGGEGTINIPQNAPEDFTPSSH